MYKLTLSILLTLACLNLSGEEDIFLISDAAIEKIHSKEFINLKKTFAESPPIFKNQASIDIPKAIAFEDSRQSIRLTPGDIIKISEDLTFSDWGAKSAVAEEDFNLKDSKKKVEDTAPNSKGIKFSM